MKLRVVFTSLCLVHLLLLDPATGLTDKLATHGDLAAYLKDACAERVTVRVEAPSPAPFYDPSQRSDLDRLFATLRAGLAFECQQAQTIYLKGYVGSTEVYRGIASAAADWILVDVPFSAGKAAAASLKSLSLPMSSRPGNRESASSAKQLSPEDRIRLFGERGERAFNLLLVKGYGYRAQLLEACKPGEGKQLVALEMTAFFTQSLPQALPEARKLFDSYLNEKGHHVPPCTSADYEASLAWNKKEVEAQKNITHGLIGSFSARVLQVKRDLSEMKFYDGPIDDNVDQQFLTSLKTWFDLWYFGPVERQRFMLVGDVMREIPWYAYGRIPKGRPVPGREPHHWPYVDYGGVDAGNLLRYPIELVTQQAIRQGPGGFWMFTLLRVGWIQQALKAFGYYAEAIDGQPSKELDTAMRKYYAEHPELSKQPLEKLLPGWAKLWSKQLTYRVPAQKLFDAAARDVYLNVLVLTGLEEIRESPNQMKVRLIRPYLEDLGWLPRVVTRSYTVPQEMPPEEIRKLVNIQGGGEGILDPETIRAIQEFKKCKIIEEEDARIENQKIETAVYLDDRGIITDALLKDLVKVWSNVDRADAGSKRQTRAARTGQATCEE